MIGFIVLISSFILAIITRVILRKKDNCLMAKVLPYIIMIFGGVIGSYLYIAQIFKDL